MCCCLKASRCGENEVKKSVGENLDNGVCLCKERKKKEGREGDSAKEKNTGKS